ncbi:hypothetical protein JCM11641_003997 [Rhodosporidiobolus odoratus]
MASILVSGPDSPRASTTTSEPANSTSPLHLAVPPSTTSQPTSEAMHGRPRSASAATALETTVLNPDKPPPLNFQFKLKNPLLYLAFLIFCNVVIPCVLYYPLRLNTDITDKELIGIGSAALGLSSCFDAPFRMWRLTRHRAKYGPLHYPAAPDPAHQPAGKGRLMKNMPRSWWHLDFFMWTYQAGLFVFAVPLAIAPAIPLYNFFLFSFAMLIAPIGIIFALTLKSWHNLPFWMSSDPPRTSTKPAVYYFIEDVGAVDFMHGREWRKRCQARYAASPPFRALMWSQTFFWTIASIIFVGLTAVVDWISSLNVAFGVVISLIFMWAIVFGIISYIMVHFALKKELAWWRSEYAGLVAEHHAPPPLITRPSTPSAGATLSPPGVDAGQEGAVSEDGAGENVSEKGEFLGEKGLSKPGKVAQGRHRGWSIHAKLAPTPEPSLRSAPASSEGDVPPSTLSPEMVQVRDSAGRVVAVDGGPGGGGVPEMRAAGDTRGLVRRERGVDFAEAGREGTNGSPV